MTQIQRWIAAGAVLTGTQMPTLAKMVVCLYEPAFGVEFSTTFS
jgi:hypothetical protein